VRRPASLPTNTLRPGRSEGPRGLLGVTPVRPAKLAKTSPEAGKKANQDPNRSPEMQSESDEDDRRHHDTQYPTDLGLLLGQVSTRGDCRKRARAYHREAGQDGARHGIEQRQHKPERIDRSLLLDVFAASWSLAHRVRERHNSSRDNCGTLWLGSATGGVQGRERGRPHEFS